MVWSNGALGSVRQLSKNHPFGACLVIEYWILRSPASTKLRSSSRCPTKIIAHPTRALYVVDVALAKREFPFRQQPSGSWTLNRNSAARLQASRYFVSLVSS